MYRCQNLLLATLAMLCLTMASGCGYHQLQQKEKEVIAAWSEVESTYQQRAELTLQLLQWLQQQPLWQPQSLTTHPQALKDLSHSRLEVAQLSQKQAMEQFQQQCRQLETTLQELRLLVKKNSQLQQDGPFKRLHHRLQQQQQELLAGQQKYNRAARVFNDYLQGLPQKITNKLVLQLEPKIAFTLPESVTNDPTAP